MCIILCIYIYIKYCVYIYTIYIYMYIYVYIYIVDITSLFDHLIRRSSKVSLHTPLA